ncbi:hypothetical protein JCM11641_002339 [Rhodosporidiobolus odoratus]
MTTHRDPYQHPQPNEKTMEKPEAEHLETASSLQVENAMSSEKVDGQHVQLEGGRLKVPEVRLTPEEEDRMYRKVRCLLILYPSSLSRPRLDGEPAPLYGQQAEETVLPSTTTVRPGNIGNARLNGLEDELGMSSQQYNLALSCFFITYCLFEVPSNLMLKKCRPAYYIGGITIVWGIVMTCMGLVRNFGGLLATRLCLGAAEAGLFPGIVFLLSLYYPRHRSQSRVAVFFGAATLAGAFSGLLAYGIGYMNGIANYRGWRWIFILEGLATVVFGVATLWILPPYPHQVKWLTPAEREWLLYRKASDGSSVGEAEGTHNKYIWQALRDWQCWLSLGYYFGVVVPLYAISLFAPTLINSFGEYTRPQVQLLTVPIYAVACIFVLAISIYADKRQSRFPFMMIELLLCLVGFIINIAPAPSGVKYFGLFLIAMGAYAGLPTSVTWLGNNLSGSTKRAVGSAFQIGIGNLAALASTNVYRTQDQPHYYLGHGVVLGFVCIGLVSAPLYAFLLKRENAKKEWEMNLPEGERRVYTVEELRDLGDRAPEFKYTI